MSLGRSYRRALLPLSFFYGAATRARAWLYRGGILRPHRLPQIVVSVGNISVGGTGKTPMVLWLAERLLAEGKRVGILSRGYQGLGNRNNSQPARKSDEVRLLRDRTGGRVPIGAGADRFAEAQRMEKEGIEWFVLDDGFQHLQLARDVDIVLVDARERFGGELLPVGNRREPLAALARADVVVITRSTGAPEIEEQIRRHTDASIFYAQTQLESVRRILAEPASGAEAAILEGKKYFAFCGIGNPSAFFHDLQERWRIQLAASRAFRDHHVYSHGNIRGLEQQALLAGADALVCTEKDVYNLPVNAFEKLPAYFCRIKLQPSDPDGLWSAIQKAAQRRRGEGVR